MTRLDSKKLLGLFLALFLAAAPALAWSCCCSDTHATADSEPVVEQKSGHACCPESETESEDRVTASAAGCGCPETMGAPTETVTLAAAVATIDFKDSKAPLAADLAESLLPAPSPDRRVGRGDDPPPRLSGRPYSSACTRAPPATSLV